MIEKPYGKHDYNARLKAWVGVIAVDDCFGTTTVLSVGKERTEREIIEWIHRTLASESWEPTN
jgi:hypothetical protein